MMLISGTPSHTPIVTHVRIRNREALLLYGFRLLRFFIVASVSKHSIKSSSKENVYLALDRQMIVYILPLLRTETTAVPKQQTWCKFTLFIYCTSSSSTFTIIHSFPPSISRIVYLLGTLMAIRRNIWKEKITPYIPKLGKRFTSIMAFLSQLNQSL